MHALTEGYSTAVSRANVEMVQRAIDAFRLRDLEAALQRGDLTTMLDELYAPDVEFIPLRAATEGAYHDHDRLEAFIADTLETFEIFELHVELCDVGAQVLAWGTIHVRSRAGGVEMDIPTGGLLRGPAGEDRALGGLRPQGDGPGSRGVVRYRFPVRRS